MTKPVPISDKMDNRTKKRAAKHASESQTIIDYFIDYNKKTPHNLGIMGALKTFDNYLRTSETLPLTNLEKANIVLKAVRGLNVSEHMYGFFDEYVKDIREGKFSKDKGLGDSKSKKSLRDAYEEAKKDVIIILNAFAKDQKNLQSRWMKIMGGWKKTNIKPVNLRK